MIRYLTIHNYVLIQDIHVDLSERFNVFTGETGSGKSLLVDTLKFVTGQRSGPSVVGKNDDMTRVETAFELSSTDTITYLKSLDLYDEEDDFLIVSREMNREGRNVCRINQRIVNLSLVREVTGRIIDIHSQHETQYLLDSKSHLRLLDQFIEAKDLLESYQQVFSSYQTAVKKKRDLENSDLNPEEIEFARFQLAELQALNPNLEDYEETERQVRVLGNYEKTKTTMTEIHDLIMGEGGAFERLYQSKSLLDGLEDYASYSERFKDVYYLLEAFMDDFSRLNQEFTFDDATFNQLNERLYQYTALRKKHGSVAQAITKMENLEARIHQAENYEIVLSDLEREIKALEAQVMLQAQKLSDYRKHAAADLETKVVRELRDLMLEHAQFKIRFNQKTPGEDGVDDVVFTVSMNRGLDLAPLGKVVSGGELSRLMLGLKVIFSDAFGIETVVFDEIDTGVSGQVGLRIGQKMRMLSEHAQVLTISHLASVAACADHHYVISKASDDSDTFTSIDLLDQPKRIAELAFIMSGNTSPSALEAAQELYDKGQR